MNLRISLPLSTSISLSLKDVVLRNIENLFEYKKEEENYYKPVRVNNIWRSNYIEYKVTEIEIKHYQLKNILRKLDHI